MVEDRDTILELTGKIQELQNEINCIDSRDFSRLLNQHVVDNPTLPVNQCFFPPHPDPGGMLSRSLGMPSPQKTGRQAFGTHMGFRETFFANPTASSSAPYPQELKSMEF